MSGLHDLGGRFRKGLHRPPDRRRGRMTMVAGFLFFLAMAIDLWHSGSEGNDERLGPWSPRLFVLVAVLVGALIVVSASAEFQSPDQQERIMRLRTIAAALWAIFVLCVVPPFLADSFVD